VRQYLRAIAQNPENPSIDESRQADVPKSVALAGKSQNGIGPLHTPRRFACKMDAQEWKLGLGTGYTSLEPGDTRFKGVVLSAKGMRSTSGEVHEARDLSHIAGAID